MRDRLDEIKSSLRRKYSDEFSGTIFADMRYLLTRLEAAEAVVEAARRYQNDDGDDAKHTNMLQLRKTLAAYDKVKQ